MDGGQPLNEKKLKTVQERIHNQIQHCLCIQPNNQYIMKIFPGMGRPVFVSTLKKMGIQVLQADFEADEEIAVIAKKLGHTVLSNDSDFFVYDVPFILLDTINYKNVHLEKRCGKSFSYMSCSHFNVEKFCQVSTVSFMPPYIVIYATLHTVIYKAKSCPFILVCHDLFSYLYYSKKYRSLNSTTGGRFLYHHR